MKNKILKIAFCFVLFTALLITASFAVEIKEDVADYNSDVFIIGSTRFDANQVITATMAANAGVNEAKANLFLYGDISNLKVTTYYYSELFGEWNEVKENGDVKLLTDSEVEELEENLNIFFVNNEEKVLEVPYTGTVDEGTIWSPEDNVTFSNGTFKVPVLTNVFTFLSNNVANEVQTNVIESILSGEEIVENVEIIPEWADFEINGTYYEADSISEVFASNEELEVKLLKDTDLPTAVVVSTKATLDLNGYVLTAKTDTVGDGIFKVVTGGDLTINGEGLIDSACLTNDYSMAIWATGEGKVTINGGTYTNVGAKDFEDDGITPNNNELIYASSSAQITINDGTFIGNTDNKTYGARYALNLKDTSNATITVKGGTFIGYNPSNSASENPKMNFLADGYKVVIDYENEYAVEPIEESDVILADGIACEDLQTAVDNASKVKLLQDIDLETAVVVSTKVTLDLNGCTLTAKEDPNGDGIFKVVTGGDLTINGEGTIDSACDTNDYSMAIWATGEGKVTINGGTYTNVGAKSVEDDGTTPNNNELIYASGSAQITINGGEFIGNTENTTYGARYTLNLKDQDNAVASIVVKGGTFTGYDPANSKSENPTANLVAEGYESILGENDVYTVVEKAN